MAGDPLGAAYVTVSADVRRLRRDLETERHRIGRWTDRVSRTARITVGLVGTAAIVQAFRKIVQEASHVQELTSRFGVVFRGISYETWKWADALGKSLRRNTYDVMEWAASFQDTFVPLGYTREAAADLSKQLTELTIDLASFAEKSDPEVARALISALVGNHEAVRELRIMITEAGLKEKIFAMGLAKTSKEITMQDKVLGRLAMMIEQSSDALGDAARTTDEYANTSKGLDAQIRMLSASMGAELLPEMTRLKLEMLTFVKAISPQVISVFRGLAYGVTNLRYETQILIATFKGNTKEVQQLMKSWQAYLAQHRYGARLTREAEMQLADLAARQKALAGASEEAAKALKKEREEAARFVSLEGIWEAIQAATGERKKAAAAAAGAATTRPTSQPTSRPTSQPTSQPTTRPTSQPAPAQEITGVSPTMPAMLGGMGGLTIGPAAWWPQARKSMVVLKEAVSGLAERNMAVMGATLKTMAPSAMHAAGHHWAWTLPGVSELLRRGLPGSKGDLAAGVAPTARSDTVTRAAGSLRDLISNVSPSKMVQGAADAYGTLGATFELATKPGKGFRPGTEVNAALARAFYRAEALLLKIAENTGQARPGLLAP